jgi:hypothetical protein
VHSVDGAQGSFDVLHQLLVTRPVHAANFDMGATVAHPRAAPPAPRVQSPESIAGHLADRAGDRDYAR